MKTKTKLLTEYLQNRKQKMTNVYKQVQQNLQAKKRKRLFQKILVEANKSQLQQIQNFLKKHFNNINRRPIFNY